MKSTLLHRDIVSLLPIGSPSLSSALIFVLLLLCASAANARLSGDASLTYTSYDGRANGSRRMTSNSLVQNYSLMYSSAGTIYNSRVGRYDVSLGYNWTSIDTTFKSSTQPTENFSTDRGHILYKGEINLDPKEVPIKLNIYSRDMVRNTMTTSTGRGYENFGTIIGFRDQATSINDGLHIESGATMVAGVKSGITNGYNDLMRNFPMILIDYKDTINRDLRAANPVDDRLSRLAFVSLNKKDNWFHYRLTKYNDYLNSLNNYSEKQFQLGTIDENMARRWVDFSNWLTVSTDLQFSRKINNDQKNPIDDINLNLFAAAERTTWNARTFSTFNRYKDENNKLTYQTTLPLYASGVVNPDTSWNARTTFRDNHDLDTQGLRSNFTNMLVGYRLDTYKRAPFTLSQSLDVESSQANTSDFLTLSGTLETTSTPRYSRIVTLGASYNIKNSLTSSATASSSDFLEQTLNLRAGYEPVNTVRFEARQSLTLTQGNFSTFGGTTRDSNTQLSQYVNPRNFSNNDAGSESFHSVTTLIAAWNPKPRLNTSLSISEDVYKSSVVGLNPITEVAAGASFANDAWSVSDTLKYTQGSREYLDDKAYSVSNSSSLRYIHSRNLDASATASYTTDYYTGSTAHSTSFEQSLNYNFFTRTGIARKLLEFNETLMYSDGSANTLSDYKRGLFLGFKYYPINRLTLAAGAGYSYSMTSKDYTLIWNTSAAANFNLLQASLDYIYGIRKSDGARESKFIGNIRKSF